MTALPAAWTTWTQTVAACLELELEHESSSQTFLHITNLRASQHSLGLGGKPVLALASASDRALPAIDPGTPVRLAPANLPLASSLPLDCLVVCGEPLRVSLSSSSSASAALQNLGTTLWVLDQVPDATTSKRILKSLACCASTKWPRVLFDAPKPTLAFDPAPSQPLDFFDPGLNDAQKRAVSRALLTRDVFAIHGPPGTGKSSVLVELIRQLAAANRRVLACAPSNVAVDNLLLRLSPHALRLVRLGHPSRVDARILPWCLDAIVDSSEAAALLRDARGELNRALAASRWSEAKALRREIKARERKAIRECVGQAQVVLCTLSGSAKLGKLLGEGDADAKRFFLVVDEAAQASLAAAMVPLAMAEACVVAGDHRQLAPTVKSPAVSALEESLMERVAARFGSEMLNVQYRMHERIMGWASRATYAGLLVSGVALRDEVAGEDELPPMLLIDTDGCDGFEEVNVSDSFCNPAEVGLAIAHVARLLKLGLRASEVAVIAPYSAQIALIKEALARGGAALAGVEAKTVDGFQGQERLAVVFSCVRSNAERKVGFLSDQRRINVAVTRAKRHVCVIGDSSTLRADPFMKMLIEYVEEHGEVRSAAEFEGEAAEVEVRAKEARRGDSGGGGNRGASTLGKGKKKTRKSKARAAVARTPAAPTVSEERAEPPALVKPSVFAQVAADAEPREEEEDEESSKEEEPLPSARPGKPREPPAQASRPSPAPLPPNGSDDADEDAFLAQAGLQASRCSHASCAQAVAVTGFNCALCRNRYCASHRLPEVHGCALQARERAQARPAKPALRPSERRELEKTLRTKVAAKASERGAGKRR